MNHPLPSPAVTGNCRRSLKEAIDAENLLRSELEICILCKLIVIMYLFIFLFCHQSILSRISWEGFNGPSQCSDCGTRFFYFLAFVVVVVAFFEFFFVFDSTCNSS